MLSRVQTFTPPPPRTPPDPSRPDSVPPPGGNQRLNQDLDEETMTCKSSGVMKTLAWVFGVFFGVTEMAGHFLR